MSQSSLPALSIARHFTTLTDPRIERTKRHELADIIVIAICAFVCGCKSWKQVAIYGRKHTDWLKTFLKLPNGIPSKDTFRRVFARLKPAAFERGFRSWTQALVDALGIKHIAIDGKTSRRSHDRGAARAALHLVSAWAAANHLTLGQVAVDDKSNEITAIPQLLELLELSGAIVTIDAMGCQKEIAAQIREQGGHYLLAVKGNQEGLFADVQACFEREMEKPAGKESHSYHHSKFVGHGRIEERHYYTIEQPEGIRDLELWKDLSTITMVVSERQLPGAQPTLETRYYIGSKAQNAKANGRCIRGHWSIENTLHWTLDMVFDEDRNRTRKDHGPENMARLRRLALSILKNYKELKGTTPTKQFEALLDHRVLERMLVAFSGE
jgi:predicted transposase YbfD/YdcC